ncbi:hypothetical protein [Alteromonas gilva]|uniref:Uncharacterized protein n=1 Tax=Alteromonas gilva TaxID=2987522 RepID=A0ABT5KZ73_9ALTE|nr:hypothetical protein [Alteromonas gilva]MDC8829506.1 hypothetical protein [Alteromonas gilva]
MWKKHHFWDAIFTLLAAVLGIALFFEPGLIAYDIVRITVLIGLTVLPVKYLLKIRALSKQ